MNATADTKSESMDEKPKPAGPRYSREVHPEDTIIRVGGVAIGGGHFAVIAGPCAVESEKQLVDIAMSVQSKGAHILRGGAFKPRSSPYSFQGMGNEGVKLLESARRETNMPIISEIMDVAATELFDEHVDIIQVGARNCQNFALLKRLAQCKKPVLLKRGMMNTIQEFLSSAEYLMSEGKDNIILCERGIRTFETATRNTLDLSAIPVIKKKSHLPVIVDPSHAVGYSEYVAPLAMAALAVGADGLMIEVHNDPCNALCDGEQSMTPDAFGDLMKKLARMADVMDMQI